MLLRATARLLELLLEPRALVDDFFAGGGATLVLGGPWCGPEVLQRGQRDGKKEAAKEKIRRPGTEHPTVINTRVIWPATTGWRLRHEGKSDMLGRAFARATIFSVLFHNFGLLGLFGYRDYKPEFS